MNKNKLCKKCDIVLNKDNRQQNRLSCKNCYNEYHRKNYHKIKKDTKRFENIKLNINMLLDTINQFNINPNEFIEKLNVKQYKKTMILNNIETY